MCTTLLLALLALSTATAAPLATQGQLVDPAGGPINGTHSLTVQFFDRATGGSEVWAKPYDDLVIEDGYYSLMLDGADDAGRNLEGVMNSDAWMVISVDGSPLLPRQPVQGVPQAIRAQSSVTAESADRARTADEADYASSAGRADEATYADLAGEADHATTADSALLADEAILAQLASEADHAATADEAILAQLASEADHAATADEAVLAERASEAEHAATADSAAVAGAVPIINATAACSTPGAIGYDASLASGAICDGSAWQVLESATAAQGQRRLLVADRLRSDSNRAGSSAWQYYTLPQSYTIQTNGGNVRVYFKAMTYLHATTGVGSAQQAGLIIHPIIDGVRQDYCDYLYVRGWGTNDDLHGPVVCDTTFELSAGEHTIGFEHRYYGFRSQLYGGPRRSTILIEELPTAIDYQGDW
ncbi:MAG: hypothetical protein ACJATT_005151 [Myxococcota bacterium]|jgi:hypothetical protein